MTDTAGAKDGSAPPAEGPAPPAEGPPAEGSPAEGSPAEGSQADATDLAPDERNELEKLRKEVTELRARPRRPWRRFGWRAPVATLLIFLGCVLAPVSVIGVWTANQISDTNRYVANMTPLIQNPAIQGALTDKISNAINAQINVQSLAKQTATQLNQHGLTRLATLLQSFSGQIASAVQGFIHSTVARVIASPAMASAWVAVNRLSHQAIVTALSGRGNGAVTTSNGQVVLNVGPLVTVAKQDLVNAGLTVASKIPTVNATFPLFPSKYLTKAQTGYRLVNDLKIVLPILTLLLLAAGVYVARRRRRALIAASLGFAASMLVLGIALLIIRGQYLNAVPAATLPSDAAAAAFDILIRFIREALRALLLVGLIVAAGAFITGPSAAAVRIRSWFRSALAWIRGSAEHRGISAGPVGEWTYAHRRGLRVGVVALLAVIFVFIGHPSVAEVIWLLVLLVVLLGLIELIGRPPAPGAVTESSPPQAPPPTAPATG